jgi:uncharacterized protein YggE
MRALGAFAAALVLASPALAQVLPPARSITVSGMAERQVTPDEAHVMVNIRAQNMKLDAAKSDHDRKLKALLALARKNDIAESAIKTQSSTVQPAYDYANNKRMFKGYVVQTSVDITIAPLDNVGSFCEAVLNAGFEDADADGGNLLSVNYSLAHPDQLRDAMMVDAIKNARAKAEQMASAADAHLGHVLQITDAAAPNFAFPRPMMAMRAMAASGSPAPVAPPPGAEEVNASVTVSYELTV